MWTLVSVPFPFRVLWCPWYGTTDSQIKMRFFQFWFLPSRFIRLHFPPIFFKYKVAYHEQRIRRCCFDLATVFWLELIRCRLSNDNADSFCLTGAFFTRQNNVNVGLEVTLCS